jgi:hypothetical protein
MDRIVQALMYRFAVEEEAIHQGLLRRRHSRKARRRLVRSIINHPRSDKGSFAKLVRDVSAERTLGKLGADFIKKQMLAPGAWSREVFTVTPLYPVKKLDIKI